MASSRRAGPLTRLRRRRDRRARIAIEDALKHIHAAEEREGIATVESLAGAVGISTRRAAELVRALHERGLAATEEGLRLTPAGERWARSIVRAHRLWERYLADELRMPSTAVHRLADRKEHELRAADLDRLEAGLGYPEHDPHGDPIPAASGRLARRVALPLTMMAEHAPGRIVHLEDEPEAVYEKLAALGFEPGQRVEILEASPRSIRLELDGTQLELAPVDAANVFVAPVEGEAEGAARTLADLAAGEAGRIAALRVSGSARRRLLDLGFTPGTVVERVMTSPLGEPTAYRIRGTMIALRPEQATRIELEPEGGP
jgi:DtxR family Mn-dependent transcriptional regulator